MPSSTNRLSRRTVFTGAGAVGAIAAVASLLPSRVPEAEAPAPLVQPKPARGGGYTLSEHVKHYYKTTRV
ncbi:MAG: formate dehydrogenase [Rhodoferax sp.]|jgi:hypothetical protein|nr:formate dehydrogenase [Rhodoferax sp.]